MGFFSKVLSDTPDSDEYDDTFSDTRYQYFVVGGFDDSGNHVLRGIATSRYRLIPVLERDVIEAVATKYNLTDGYVYSSMYIEQGQSKQDFDFFCAPADSRPRSYAQAYYWLTYAYQHTDGTFRIIKDSSYGTFNNFTNICEMEADISAYLLERFTNQALDDTMEAISPSLPISVTLIKWERMR